MFIDIDYKDAFTFVHLAEQAEKVNYRYKKNFSGIFIDQFNKSKKVKVSMFVRKSFVKSTAISKKLDKIFYKKNILKQTKFKNIIFSVLKIPEAYNFLCDDIKKKRGLVFYKKQNG